MLCMGTTICGSGTQVMSSASEVITYNEITSATYWPTVVMRQCLVRLSGFMPDCSKT